MNQLKQIVSFKYLVIAISLLTFIGITPISIWRKNNNPSLEAQWDYLYEEYRLLKTAERNKHELINSYKITLYSNIFARMKVEQKYNKSKNEFFDYIKERGEKNNWELISCNNMELELQKKNCILLIKYKEPCLFELIFKFREA